MYIKSSVIFPQLRALYNFADKDVALKQKYVSSSTEAMIRVIVKWKNFCCETSCIFVTWIDSQYMSRQINKLVNFLKETVKKGDNNEKGSYAKLIESHKCINVYCSVYVFLKRFFEDGCPGVT